MVTYPYAYMMYIVSQLAGLGMAYRGGRPPTACSVKLYFGLKSYKYAKKKATRHNSYNKNKRTQSHIKKNVLQLFT